MLLILVALSYSQETLKLWGLGKYRWVSSKGKKKINYIFFKRGGGQFFKGSTWTMESSINSNLF